MTETWAARLARRRRLREEGGAYTVAVSPLTEPQVARLLLGAWRAWAHVKRQRRQVRAGREGREGNLGGCCRGPQQGNIYLPTCLMTQWWSAIMA